MTLLVSSTVLSLLVGAAPTSVFIAEVAYNVAEESTDEWVELVNLSDVVVSLDEVRVGDEETIGGTEAILAFPLGATIEPWSAVVIATNATRYATLNGRLPDFELKATVDSVGQMTFDRSLGGARFELANTSDEIVLLDAQGLLLDGVSWGRTTALPGMVNTPVTPEGKTLTRPFSATNGPEPWRIGTPTPGVVAISGLSGTIPTEGEGEGEGESPIGEGEGEGEGEAPVGEGEGEGEGEEPVGEGEGEGEEPVGEGEGEGEGEEPVGEGEGEAPVGEGEGESPGGEGEAPDDDGAGVDLIDRPKPPVTGPPESVGCSNGGGAPGSMGVLLLGLSGLRRRRR